MPLYEFEGIRPEVPAADQFWVAPDATVVGKVRLAENTSVWFNAVFGTLMGQFYQVFYIFSMIGLLTASGAYIPLIYAPDRIKWWLEWNPLYQVVNWLRSAYYTDNTLIEVDRLYLIGVASIFLLVGLAGERLLRGKLLAP